ncbi:C45 family peptidase [Flammeovirga sp. OC4]|uniref:C45 family autoproteolytic acyltransferase/hydolase n=1 Tax=Flammeovirga sp. OC4 TaxID=1382345 RepID=UPI0005C71941|nr:C45 family peptidase [Flammeovirga sp. OC4]
MKKFSIIFSFIIALTLNQLISSSLYAKSFEFYTPEVQYVDGIFEITIDADTPFERGLQHGVALNTQINQGILSFKQWISKNTSIEDVDAFLSKFVNENGYALYTKQHTPDLYEELEGIAEGASIPFDVLFAYQAFDELFTYFANEGFIDLQGHCTTVGIEGKQNIVTHNNDIPTYFKGLNTLLRIKNPTTGHVILQGTFAGVIAQNGVNNHGIAVGINTVANIKGNKTGLPVAFNVRKILEQENVEDALSFLRSVQCAQPMNYMIGDKKNVICVEVYGEGQYDILKPNHNFIVHTNHTLSDKTPQLFEMSEEDGGASFANTLERLKLANEWLEKKENTITKTEIMELKSGPMINVFPGNNTGRTLQSMIVVLPRNEAPYVYYTGDSPSISSYTRFSF